MAHRTETRTHGTVTITIAANGNGSLHHFFKFNAQARKNAKILAAAGLQRTRHLSHYK